MDIPEFVGGLLLGFSVFVVVIGSFFLPEFDSNLPLATDYYELFLPWAASVVAGVGIGFGLRSDDGPGYGGFSGELSDQWPTLIGGLGLAGAVGSIVMLFLSGTPTVGIGFAIASISLAVVGLVLAIMNWQTSGF